MTLQPAAGVRDLNPQQVEINHMLTKRLAQIYRFWGYEEVSPPRIERIDTLKAGGAIDSNDIVRLVADEPLGLRPEMTASIARAASTRLAQKPRPLRLWASGTVFETKETDERGLFIEENLQSGVELFGVQGMSAEKELLSLLLDAMNTLDLETIHRPTLLVGHTGLMDLILTSVPNSERERTKQQLIDYDKLSLENSNLESFVKNKLVKIQNLRGSPTDVLDELTSLFNDQKVITELHSIFQVINDVSRSQEVSLQLDPTFQPHFNLYTGIVFQLICKGQASPVVIARGGRYDELVSRCGAEEQYAAGVGFSFAIDKIRELKSRVETTSNINRCVLVAYKNDIPIERAIYKSRQWHSKGFVSIVELDPCTCRSDAIALLPVRGCNELDWIEN